MIDLKAARANPDPFVEALRRRNSEQPFIELLAVDSEWRAQTAAVDELRARQKLSGKPTPEQLEGLRQVKEQLGHAEARLGELESRRHELLERIPNPPDASAPDGSTDEDAVEIRRWGEPPQLAEAKEHTEIGRFDMERAARVSGSRFGYMVGDTALVALALYRFALDRVVAHGHVPVLTPVLVREEPMYGTGFFPSEKNDYYEVPADGLYLVGTSEVPLAAFHMGEVLEKLPLRYAGFSSCFRRESGAAGRDTRGMFRVHQFQKVEMFSFVRPEESRDEHERLLAIEEELAQALGIPYRVVNVAAGDLGGSAAKKYDVEAWFPSQERYREITSTSNTTDYQARRLGVRFRGERGLETPHTLNGTAVTDRWLLAILENFGGEIPEPLQAFGAPAAVTR
jgi:seryl-tRNA synthetase